MGAYLILFYSAAQMYPGGSYNHPDAQGYSLFHNFLCDVMEPVTRAGIDNPARHLAIVSHLVLSFTMVSFFYLLPEIFQRSNLRIFLIRYVGVLTMTVFVFMFSSYHDLIVTLTGLLGTIALVPFFIELRGYPNFRLRLLAYVCFGLSLVVYFIFQTKLGFYYLPFLQKITFVLDAVWVVWVSLIVRNQNKLSPELVTQA